MEETWYVTEAGDPVDPAECGRKDGVLTHKSGAKIAMRFPDCPRSRSVDPSAERAKAEAARKKALQKPADDDAEPSAKPRRTREMKAGDDAATYRTR